MQLLAMLGRNVRKIEATAIVLSLVVSFIAVYYTKVSLDNQRLHSTIQLISGFSESSVASGGTVLARAAINQPQSYEEFLLTMADLAPLRQHMIAFAACITEKLCDRELGLALLCERLLSYEDRVEVLLDKFNREAGTRRGAYRGLYEECKARSEGTPT